MFPLAFSLPKVIPSALRCLSVNSLKTHSLLGKLAGVHIRPLLDTEAEPEYRHNEPALKVKMTREGGEVLDCCFSKPEDASCDVLKCSDLDHYFVVAKYTADLIMETTGKNLVQPRTEEVSSEPAGDNPDEKDDDASAAEEQESDAGGEPTDEDE